MEVAVSQELDYSQKILSEPSYQYTRILPQSGTTTFALQLGGGNDIIFELPPTKAFNLSQSWIQCSVTIPAQGGGLFAWLFSDFYSLFRQIQLYTRGGLMFLDLQDAHLYSKMTIKRKMPKNKYVSSLSKFVGANNIVDTLSVCSPNNTVNDFRSFYYNEAATSPNTKLIEETNYLVHSDANAAWSFKVKIFFDDFKDTILALNKDIMANETLLLRVVLNDFNNLGHIGTAPAAANDPFNPGAGAANFAVSAGAQLTNVELRLAIEQNLSVLNGLQSKIASPEGFSVLIDYPYYNNYSGTGTNQSVTLRVNRANGLTLKRIYHSLFRATSILQGVYGNNNNLATPTPSPLVSFYTNLNNNRLMQYDYVILNYDDYRANAKCFYDSAIVSLLDYYRNWVWNEEFGDCTDVVQDDSNYLKGLDLNLGEQKWDFMATTDNNPYTHISYVICQRKLVISNAGIMLI